MITQATHSPTLASFMVRALPSPSHVKSIKKQISNIHNVEGTNGRLPNQDVINTVSKVAQYTGQVPLRYHNISNQPLHRIPWLGRYMLAAKHLLHHFAYAALGRSSAGHGPLAKYVSEKKTTTLVLITTNRYRIDSLTIYCTPATGPHGFHTLGRTLESTLRSFNNLLERLHASYFFYLLPFPDHFIPVGNYLPAAVLLGASLTVGGLDCPTPEEGVGYLVFAFGSAFLLWAATQTQTGMGISIVFSALFVYYPRPRGRAYRSLKSMTFLLYGALIPTLAMVNFAQSILLASFAYLYLHLYPYLNRGVPGWSWVVAIALTAPCTVLSILKGVGKVDLEEEWQVLGNFGWVGVYVVWVPLWILGVMLLMGEEKEGKLREGGRGGKRGVGSKNRD